MTTTATSRIGTKIVSSVARIKLVNPPLNIIDLQMARELLDALMEIEARTDVSAIVFEGTLSAFSAGVNIQAHLPEHIHEMLTSFHAVIRAIVASHKVTIAAVCGVCLGGGAELASVCDVVYTARDATWGFPEIKLACYPPVAAVTLPALVGQKRAAELILTGRQISGDEAVAIGLANGSAQANELDALVEETLDELRQLSSTALAHAKKAMYAWDAIHFDKGLARAEKIYLEELISTTDAREGIIAFLDKRPPKWTGR
ncbi:MAG TPA: enoyl-CoA hydratase/isomerase family protein [Terriglobales bacterium]|jgi:cyclohexa-1,5-dienecarbonyl-CoA hydratase|nr:enoyl-CoA hydratase/isomerase family protein [Terriglobales bacterium]